MNKRIERLTTTLTAASVFALGATACSAPMSYESKTPNRPATTTKNQTPETIRLIAIAQRIAELRDSTAQGISALPEDSKPAFTSGFEYKLDDNTVVTVTEQTSVANNPASVVAVEISKKKNGVVYFTENFLKTNKETWNGYVSTQAKNGDMVSTEQIISGDSVLLRDIATQKTQISNDPVDVSKAFLILATQVDKQLAPIGETPAK